MVGVSSLQLNLSKLILCAVLVGPSVHATDNASMYGTGSICKITEGLPLYLGHQRDDLVTTLEAGASLTLRVEHLERWLVRAADGTLGVVAKDAFPKRLSCSLVENPVEVASSDPQAAPALEAADISEVAEALEATKAKAAGIDIPDEIMAEQASKVARAVEISAAEKSYTRRMITVLRSTSKHGSQTLVILPI